MPKFRILAVDNNAKGKFPEVENVLYLIKANQSLWNASSINIKKNSIIDGSNTLSIKKVKLDDQSNCCGFNILLDGEFEEIHERRENILNYLNAQGFTTIYILQDEISEKISCDLYPLLYRVENLLREYVIQFMVTQLGPKWWDIIATNDQDRKVNNRVRNEIVYSKYIDNKAYLIDFGDLGRIIYHQSAGYKNIEDLVKQILAVDESPNAIRELKNRLQTNYQRFFKETFQEKCFQEKWENFEKIRNKIAHNNLFTYSDWIDGKRLAEELIEIIQEANMSSETLEIPDDERASLRESFAPDGYKWPAINEDDFLMELSSQEDYFQPRGYVGLAHFVKSVLGAKGYDYSHSYELAEILASNGSIEKYEVVGERDGAIIPAIRLVKKIT